MECTFSRPSSAFRAGIISELYFSNKRAMFESQLSRTSLIHLDYFTGEADNFHKLSVTQLTSNRPENTCTSWVPVIVNKHNGIAVKPNVTAIIAPTGLPTTNNHTFNHRTGFDIAAWNCLLDTQYNHITKRRITPA